jgi:hypothetical protein
VLTFSAEGCVRAFAQASLTFSKGVEMRIRRLGYAGIEIEASGEIIVIDLLMDTSKLSVLREPAEVFPSPSRSEGESLGVTIQLVKVGEWIDGF